MGAGDIGNRKDDHLRAVREGDVASITEAGWCHVRLPHQAAPELDAREVSLETEFLGLRFSAPFLISSMTGGTPEGEAVNRRLAELADRLRIPMGVGSQRIQLERDRAKHELFDLRRHAPGAVLFSNLGLVQLNYGVTPDDCAAIVERLEAQALVFHLNPLQEAIQAEGDRNFSGLWAKVESVRKRLKVPLILKEVGSGLDAKTCRRARDAGFDAVDVAGLGGTHWGYIEGLRSPSRKRLGEMFRDWGLPTAEALKAARGTLPLGYPVVASGGIRNGLEAAKAIFLGADLVGLAAPFLRAASTDKALADFADELLAALRIALFCTGSRTPSELRNRGPFPVQTRLEGDL